VGREVATWRDEHGGQSERFAYDVTNQVKRVNYRADQVWTGTPLNGMLTQDFAYTPDKLNRQSVTENGAATNYAANPLNQYGTVGNQTLGYDNRFNLSGYSGAAFTFNAKNYNIYGAGPDEILWRWQANVGYLRYHLDRNGNVAYVLDGTGAIVESYYYDVFGKPTIFNKFGWVLTASGYDNRFLFQGREWIPELSIYDYRHRMYDPGLGRFLQADPTGFDAGDMNLFRYCGDDPVDMSDPTGLVGTGTGSTLEERMRLFYGTAAGRDGLYDLDHRGAGLTMATVLGEGNANSGLKVKYARSYPGKGAGGRSVVERALFRMKGTARGKYFYSQNRTVEIRPLDDRVRKMGHYTGSKTGNDYIYLNPNDDRFYDAGTFRDLSRHPGEIPPSTDDGRAAILGHEFGHLFGGIDENYGGRNVRDNENAIRLELHIPPRRSVGGHQFPLDE
jgi:RHS repeat-associated protein